MKRDYRDSVGGRTKETAEASLAGQLDLPTERKQGLEGGEVASFVTSAPYHSLLPGVSL